MASKYSEKELEQLYDIACAQGWDALEQSERIAVGRWCKSTGRKRPGAAPTSPAAEPIGGDVPRTVSVPDAGTAKRIIEHEMYGDPESEAVKPVVGGEEYFKALNLGEAGDAGARTDEDLRLLRCVEFVERFPDDIVTPNATTGKWDDPARALKRFPKPARIADDLTRKTAYELRRTISKARTNAWKPAGAYRAEIAPDHRHEGKWCVYAQYVGEAS